MPKRLILKILLFFIPIVVKADQPRAIFEHFSENKRFVLQLMINENKICDYGYLDDNHWKLDECYWRVIDSSKMKEIYRFQKGDYDWFIEVNVYVTNDGMNSVAVNDWPAWGLDSSTIFLTFFSKNKKISSFKASEILSTFKHIRSTASHYFWGKHEIMTKNEFEFETFDMTKFRFSLKKGLLLSKKRSSFLDSNKIRVLGKIDSTIDNSVFSIKIYCVLFSKKPVSEIIKYKVQRKYWEKFKMLVKDKYSDDITICIRNGIYLKTEQWQEYTTCPE